MLRVITMTLGNSLMIRHLNNKKAREQNCAKLGGGLFVCLVFLVKVSCYLKWKCYCQKFVLVIKL